MPVTWSAHSAGLGSNSCGLARNCSNNDRNMTFGSYYDQPDPFKDPHYTKCGNCVSRHGKVSTVDAMLCENLPYIAGTALVDTGCQTQLFQRTFEKFMTAVQESKFMISGFDGSEQQGACHGKAEMYFMRTDKSAPESTGQGVEFTFDTVDQLTSNLFAVSDYYEQGADILFQHNGFSGVRGFNPVTKEYFEIPCVYSHEHHGFIVHFVMAKSREEAKKHGAAMEKRLQKSTVQTQRLLANNTLSDEQLLAAMAVTRGNITIRDNDNYMMMNLGNWSHDESDEQKQAFCDVIGCDKHVADRICFSYPATTRSKASEDMKDTCKVDLGTTGDDTKGSTPLYQGTINKDCDHESNSDEYRTELLDEYYKEYDAAFSGMKDSLDSKHRKMKDLQLHINSGHMGHHPECSVCKNLKRSLRRRYQRTDPHIETRIGHTWGFDLLTWKTESLNGNKYTLVMRDFATGYFKLKHMKTRDQVTSLMADCIDELRSDPRFKLPSNSDYEIVSELRCDPAGEQRDDNATWIEMCKKHGTRCVWSDPTDKRSDGFAEQAVKMIELTTKSIMASNAVPQDWWEPCANQAAEIRNHVPLSRNVKSGDGDAITPIEELSRGRVSRRMCCRYMSHLVTCGTPCHVSQKPEATKGSDNTTVCRHKPGIAYEMIGDMPSFKSPITGAIFRSKSYLTFDPAPGVSAYEFFGCENPSPLPTYGFPAVEEEKTPHLVVYFDDIGEYHSKAMPPNIRKPSLRRAGPGKAPKVTVTDDLGFVYETDETGEYRRTTGLIQRMEDAELTATSKLSQNEQEKQLLKYDPEYFIHRTVYMPFDDEVYEGIVRYIDQDSATGRTFWNVLFSDDIDSDLWDDEMVKWAIDYVDGRAPGRKIVKRANGVRRKVEQPSKRRPESYETGPVDSGGDSRFIIMDEKSVLIDSDLCKIRLKEHDGYYTSHGDTFKDVCRAIGLNKAQWRMYYAWVHENFMRGATFLSRDDSDEPLYPDGVGFQDPFQKGVRAKPLPDNIKFPLPQGPLWDSVLRKHSDRSNDLNLEHQNARTVKNLIAAAARQAVHDTERHRCGESEEDCYEKIVNAMNAHVNGTINPDHIVPPKNFDEAMTRENWDDWLHVTILEIKGMERMGVFSQEAYTIEELRRMGIKHAPMPLGLIYDVKQHPDNSWDKDKARLVMKGHRWNMRKTFGFDHTYETYAATPDLTTTRLMQALMTLLKWTPIAFDIKMAYINSDIPDEEQVPVQFEKALRQYDEKGNELFRILRKCLYGSPTASRRFTQMRDAWMLEHFNTNGWSCTQMQCDRSLFKFTSPDGHICLATLHSDDVDMICELASDGALIADAFNKRFGGEDDGIKMCDPGFMLGVQRTTTYDEDTDTTFHELTQKGCITDLYNEYKDQLPKGAANTPMPAGTFLSMYTPDGERREQDESVTAGLKEAGYMHIVGTLLWMSRNCFPEIAQGLSQLCSVMSKPNQEAYDAALHMIKYVYEQKDRGIRFNSKGNWDPLVLYDASNKGDYADQKVSAGHVVMLAGGPISWQSKKAQHIGTSSSHNEYMAAFHAAKEAKWIRDLLIEIDLPMYDWNKPFVMLGDNDQATRWATHGMVTTANKSVRMNYHWVQECIRDGFIDMRRVPTELNTADVFTKTLGEDSIYNLRPGLTGYGELPPVPEPLPT